MTGKNPAQFSAMVHFGYLGIPQTGKARQQEIPIDRRGARRIGVFFLGVEKDVFEVPEICFSALAQKRNRSCILFIAYISEAGRGGSMVEF